MEIKTYQIKTEEITEILIGQKNMQKLASIFGGKKYSSFLVLCDNTTKSLFADTLTNQLKKFSKLVEIHVVPNGEESKNITSLFRILEHMVEKNFDRKSAVIALGGGVIGDLATTVSGLYHRGIDCIQIPTTLLAQVDAAIGGKGAVDLRNYKNIVGVFKQPRFIIIDPSLLTTLPKDQIRSGMGEVIKYAIALDKTLFELLEKNKNDISKLFPVIIQRCIHAKMSIVQKDPYEKSGSRQLLNFGHTLGHAIELYAHLSHGEAISIGMVFATKVSQKLSMLTTLEAEQAINLLKIYGLPTTLSKNAITKEVIYKHMQKDKKAEKGIPTFVLLEGIGKAKSGCRVSRNIVDQTLDEVLV